MHMIQIERLETDMTERGVNTEGETDRYTWYRERMETGMTERGRGINRLRERQSHGHMVHRERKRDKERERERERRRHAWYRETDKKGFHSWV